MIRRPIRTRPALAVAAVIAAAASALVAAPAQAAPALVITKIHYGQTGTNLNTEYIVIKNTTGSARTITGWKMISSPATDNQAYTFPTTRLAPYATLTLYTGRGTNTATTRYWNSPLHPIWNNDGDLAVLKTSTGTTVDSCRYAGGGTTAYC
jgi:hypothetical protein